MCITPTDISIEQLIGHASPDLIGFHKDIVMMNILGDMGLFSHPARLKAITVFVCLHGEIDCSINLRRFRITANQLLVNFSSDIMQIHATDNVNGYAIMLSEDYLQQFQLDFQLRAESYIGMRGNGPISVPYDELVYLKPYYTLFRKNMADGNADVIKGLALAMSYTILSMVRRFQRHDHADTEKYAPRAQQLFDKFMTLLQAHHQKERSLQFYAGKMYLTPKYVSGMIKSYSGKGALEWINEYVVLEAKMMLRYTTMTIQEIAFALNFSTQSAFGKYFKQQVGVGPKRYRSETSL